MNELQPKSFEEFQRCAEFGNVVPIVKTIDAAGCTPLSAFSALSRDEPYAFLLESVEGSERATRYSFLGAGPHMIVRGRGDQTTVQIADRVETSNVRFPDFINQHFKHYKLARRYELPPLAGGAVGYFAYGAARWFEPSLNIGESATDDAVLMFYRTVVAFDRIKKQITLTAITFTEEAGGLVGELRRLYESALEEIERVETLLRAPAIYESKTCLPEDLETDSGFTSNWTSEDFQQAVLRVKEHIAAGDCYQVVLSQCFSKTVAASPVDVYAALRAVNPSPYMYCLRLGGMSVVGASPEMLVRCRGPRVDYRPIAGTRRRGVTKAEDFLLASEMRADEKEVAEHMMLVDLGRNDLGRVADYGSVHVEELMNVESYSHVQHLVSSLRARLRGDCDRFDAFASCFPAGTVTGAPKVRAMEIIAQLEPDPRGIYAGAMKYVDYSQNLDSCIAIRTIVMRDGKAYVQTGAGIVADSRPEFEYQETIDKAKALFTAIEIAENEVRASLPS